MIVFSVYCGWHRIGRFVKKANAERFRTEYTKANDLDESETDIREHSI